MLIAWQRLLRPQVQPSAIPLAMVVAGAAVIARVHSARRHIPLTRACRLACRATGTTDASSDFDSVDVFLSHNWGEDDQGRDNHARVAFVNQELKAQGLSTWFDDERMQGNLLAKMCDGIDSARLVLCFVTQRYLEKVSSDDSRDSCWAEFHYAQLRKGRSQMLACVMERGLRRTNDWSGPCGMVLGGDLYVDFTENDASIEQLIEAVRRRLREINRAQVDASTPTELLPSHRTQTPTMVDAAPAPEPSPSPGTQAGWLERLGWIEEERARWKRVDRDLRVSGAADWRKAVHAMVGAEDSEAQTLRWIEHLIERELTVGIRVTALTEADAESEALARELETLALLAGLPPQISRLLKDKASEVTCR